MASSTGLFSMPSDRKPVSASGPRMLSGRELNEQRSSFSNFDFNQGRRQKARGKRVQVAANAERLAAMQSVSLPMLPTKNALSKARALTKASSAVRAATPNEGESKATAPPSPSPTDSAVKKKSSPFASLLKRQGSSMGTLLGKERERLKQEGVARSYGTAKSCMP